MFTIIKQTHVYGCIPSCAASVMQHQLIPGDWNERFLMDMYKPQILDPQLQIAGFEALKIFLEGNSLPNNWTINVVGNPLAFKEFVVEKNRKGIPLLCPINQGPGNSAHCVVVADSDENDLIIYDPAPQMPDRRTESYEDFLPNWAGSFLWFEKADQQ